MNVECLPDGGLTILRGRIDPVLISDFQGEWLDSLDGWAKEKQENTVITAINSADVFLNKPSPTGRILKALGIVASGMIIGINHQSPKAAQLFHKDDTYTRGRVIIVHGGDQGAFDYAPLAQSIEEAEQTFCTVELNAGDVVLQSNPLQWHRGRNLGDSTRITAAIGARIDIQT